MVMVVISIFIGKYFDQLVFTICTLYIAIVDVDTTLLFYWGAKIKTNDIGKPSYKKNSKKKRTMSDNVILA